MQNAGGVHAQFIAGEASDPIRSKSMYAHASKPDQAAGQQPLPEWLLRQREAASKGHSRLAQPPSRLDTGSASKEYQHDTADTAQGALHIGTSGISDKGGSQGMAGEVSQSRPGGSINKGSSRAPPPNVASLTPFSAFAQHNQQMHSRSSSGSAESDAPEGPSAERKASGGLARKRSGSFGGRGAALGFMMEAQQQWRQDSFTKAAECRRNEQSSETGRSRQSSLLSNHEQPTVQPKLGSTQQQPSTAGTDFEAHSTSGSRGFKLPASAGTAGTSSQSQSAAGPGGIEQPISAGTVGQAAKASGNRGVSQHQPVQSASKAPISVAMPNPFLAAAQQWQETNSDGSTDQSHHSNDGAAALPDQPSRPNPFATAADSAAIAEQWLAARQELLEQSDQWDGSGANQGSAPARSPKADIQSGRGQSSSHTAQQDSVKQDSERRAGHDDLLFESSWGPKHSMSVKAGPPPEKSSFQKSPPAIQQSGM